VLRLIGEAVQGSSVQWFKSKSLIHFEQAVEKLSVHPSTRLRANGGGFELTNEFPFVLSLSKHAN
jgi:hypothetical protein